MFVRQNDYQKKELTMLKHILSRLAIIAAVGFGACGAMNSGEEWKVVNTATKAVQAPIFEDLGIGDDPKNGGRMPRGCAKRLRRRDYRLLTEAEQERWLGFRTTTNYAKVFGAADSE